MTRYNDDYEEEKSCKFKDSDACDRCNESCPNRLNEHYEEDYLIRLDLKIKKGGLIWKEK
ncbi:MAG: hypothetical protein AAB366_00370 [Patescibacteria group bacterium]